VLTYSNASNLVYSTGRETDCNYYFYGLDWNTGATVVRKKLGNADLFNDQGCNLSINDDSTLVFGTQGGFASVIFKKAALTATNNTTPNLNIALFPNPTSHIINVLVTANTLGEKYYVGLYNLKGQKLAYNTAISGDTLRWDIGHLPKGIYSVRVEGTTLRTPIAVGKKTVLVLKR
jgi:hypothetical protein